MKRDATGKFVSNWEKETKQRFSVSLTSTAWRLLDRAASKRGISRSEAIEHFARSLENEECLDCNRNATNARITLLQQSIVEQQRVIAAQKTESQVITILESITDAFVAFDRNWHYTYVNKAAAQILHKTPEELIGKHVWHDVFPELVGGIAYQELHRAMSQQVAVYWEEFGEPVQLWLEANAYPSNEGIAVYFRDVTERKEAEAERERLVQELEMERSRFEAVLQQMPAGVMIADAASGKLVLANEQAKQIVRYDYEVPLELEEYAGIIPFEVFRSDERSYEVNQYPLMRSLLTGEVVSNEKIVVHRNDGKQIFVDVNSAPILDRQNQIVAAVAIFQDVTERLKAESILREQTEALENQQKWLQTVLDLMPTPTIFIEPETAKVTFTNRIANELAGGDLPKNKSLDEYADAYYCSDANGERIPTERMPAVLVAQGERLENYEMNWHTPGGIRSTLCWGEILPPMYGHPATGIGMFQDVTKLKQAEAAIQEANNKVTNILESITDAFFALDREWQFTYVNKRFEEISYRSSESLIGQCIWKVFPEAVGSVFYEQYHRAIAEQVSVVVEAVRPDGLGHWYEAHAYPSVNGLSIYFRDITDRKQLELERDRLLEREQAARRQAETERKRLRDILMEVPAMFAVLS
ncbi:MAG TPA: PAS domain-containing protein, partial [Phormidium sp.]